jgi:outer membrane protein
MSKIIFVMILVGFFANSQEITWDLQKCLDYVKNNNLDIKLKKIEQKRIEKSVIPLWQNFLPQINFNASHTYNLGSTIDPATNARVSSSIQFDNFYINVSFNLLDFNKLALAKRNKIDIDKSKAEVQIIENEYQLQIAESFYQTFYTQELFKIQKQQLQNSKTIIERTEKEVIIGKKPKSDAYEIQLSIANEEKNILETKNLLFNQLNSLFQLMNYTYVALEKIELLNQPLELKQTKNNSKIKVATLNFEALNKNISNARANLLPSLSIFYNLSTFYYQPLNQPNLIVDKFNIQINDNQNQQIGLQLTVPVFNGLQSRRKIAESIIALEEAEVKIEIERQKQVNLLKFENIKIKQIEEIQKKLEEILSISQITLTNSQNKFFAGKSEASLLAIHKNQVLNTQYDLLKSRLQLDFMRLKVVILER